MIRKINAVLGVSLIVLILIHGVTGAFQLMGIIAGGNRLRSVLAKLMVVLLLIHVIFGVILTIQTLKSRKKAIKGKYDAENRVFWIRRISGLAIIIFAVHHVILFTGPSGEAFRLYAFEGLQLVMSLLLVLSVGLHVVSNIRPLMISFGSIKGRKFLIDVILVLSVVCLLFAAGFVVYYLRWNVLWKK